ncbi:MAG: hypothetical protein J6Y85_03475 [Alphaproteobacteria bacterium]|nr:hypothetical protein [Alphaproteobacteria bacterium]
MKKLWILGLCFLSISSIAQEVDCNSSGIYPISQYPQYLKCDNREVVKDNRYQDKDWSVLRKCPEERPLRTFSGCKACDSTFQYTLINDQENEVCSNREMVLDEGFVGDSVSVIKVVCPPEKPLRGRDNECHSCDFAFRVDVWNKDMCSVCPNLQPKIYFDTLVPFLGCFATCPDGEILTRMGRCADCNNPYIGQIDEAECMKCNNRFFFAGLCLFKKSPFETHPIVSFPDEETGRSLIHNFSKLLRYKVDFYSCDTDVVIFTVKGLCDLCPNREYKDGWCILKETE